ncbi:hypothetical protein [Paenibacillus lautus]|jgi:hypothetical protein|uniref:hypothetical protein n=1 Tax=Paenibacillus lautus TaxID=1401 RepID=UPI0013E34D3F|nr:hypothetical protein [Paenibacillus lautus]
MPCIVSIKLYDQSSLQSASEFATDDLDMQYDFNITASISDLVWYPDERFDEYKVHPNFKAVMDRLGITVPV